MAPDGLGQGFAPGRGWQGTQAVEVAARRADEPPLAVAGVDRLAVLDVAFPAAEAHFAHGFLLMQ
jgi:hypothetical protein